MSPMKKCGGHSIITKHKPKPKPKPKPARLTVAELKMAKDVSIKKHGFTKSTNIKYDQQLREARTWLKELVETEQFPTIPLGADELDSFDWMPGELEGTLMEDSLAPGDGITRKGLVVAIQPILKKLNAQLMPSNAVMEMRGAIHTLQMVQWSNKLCPDSRLEELGKLSPGEYWKQLPFAVKHFMMHAFATSEFTLWTRNFELAKLQYKHLTLDLKTNDDYRYAHFKVSLLDRKNWAHHQTRDEIIHGHEYQIYEQPENPNIDMYFHFLRWLKFSKQFIYHHPLEVDDYIFPAIGSNGIETPIPHDTIQKWLDEFVGACGAQYRFMYAHFGKQWSLAVIRWWGGWAEGEHRDMLIRYLLDELHHYEESHSDALRPISHEADRSFLSEHIEMWPPSKLKLCEMMVAQTKALEERILASLTAAAVGNTAIFAALGDRNTDDPGGVDYAGPHSQPSQTTPREMDEIDTDMNAGPAVLTLPENHKLCIPSIAWKGPLNLHWKQIIHDWECADPPCGHYIPLKDWDPEWLRGENRIMFGVKYHQRKLVAIEYIDRCQRDEMVFLTKWPAAREGPKRLLKAITDDLKDRKLIKSRRGHKFK
ncbi:hypothetical protein BU17DRAFT_71311 [Hysterangium stoloniferum]|nr:hypothetical protein BU17DRAFT_71311 [Hysterangium stoloniferum]